MSAPIENKTPKMVKRRSVRERASLFENMGKGGDDMKDSPSPGTAKSATKAPPKWMVDLAKKNDASKGIVDTQLKSKLRQRKMISDGYSPRKFTPEKVEMTSPELKKILEKRKSLIEK